MLCTAQEYLEDMPSSSESREFGWCLGRALGRPSVDMHPLAHATWRRRCGQEKVKHRTRVHCKQAGLTVRQVRATAPLHSSCCQAKTSLVSNEHRDTHPP